MERLLDTNLPCQQITYNIVVFIYHFLQLIGMCVKAISTPMYPKLPQWDTEFTTTEILLHHIAGQQRETPQLPLLDVIVISFFLKIFI